MDDLHEMRRLRDYVPEPSRDELDEQWQRIAAEVVDAPVRSKRRRSPRRPRRIWIPAVAAALTGALALSVTLLRDTTLIMNGRQAVAGAIASMPLLGGTDVRDIEPESAPDLSLVISGDYDVVESPEELIDSRKALAEIGWDIEVIAIGAVEEVVQGRDIWTEPSDPEPEHQLVLRVRVSEVLLADDQIADERVYVELPQGGDADGSPHYSLEEWNTAIPKGTRVMLFLLDTVQPGGKLEIDHAGRGVADDATLMQPDPQGLIVEYGGNVVTQDEDDLNELWGVSSIEEIAERVRQHLG